MGHPYGTLSLFVLRDGQKWKFYLGIIPEYHDINSHADLLELVALGHLKRFSSFNKAYARLSEVLTSQPIEGGCRFLDVVDICEETETRYVGGADNLYRLLTNTACVFAPEPFRLRDPESLIHRKATPADYPVMM